MDKKNGRFLLLTFGFPAMEGCKNDATEEDTKTYLNKILNKETPETQEIEKLFPAAVRRLKERYGDAFLNYDSVWFYIFRDHNYIIDNRRDGYEKANKLECDLCKTSVWKVDDVSEDNKIAILSNDFKSKYSAFNYRGLNLERGTYVATHNAFIFTKITSEDQERLKRTDLWKNFFA